MVGSESIGGDLSASGVFICAGIGGAWAQAT